VLDKSLAGLSYIMSLPKKQHIGIDRWKMDQILNLHRCGFSVEEIADQVDVDVSVVREVLKLSKNNH